jgi:hypothetical protein
MSYKATFFFKDSYGYGWSESIYYNFSFIEGNQLPSALSGYIQYRLGFLCNSALMTHVRLESGVNRLPYVFSLNYGEGLPGAETPPQAPSEVAFGVKWIAASNQYNRVFCRGIPSRIINGDQFNNDPTFSEEIAAWVNYVVGQGVFNVQGTAGSSTTRYTMSSGTPLPPRGFQAVVLGLPAITYPAPVRVHGFSVPGYNGRKTLIQAQTAANTYKFGGAAPAADDIGLSANLGLITIFDIVIAIGELEGITRRAAGRPFGLSRGRRSTTYSLRP